VHAAHSQVRGVSHGARASLGDLQGSRIGPVVVAELDQATPLARRFDCVIRRPVVMPSVAHKTARHALDVHDFSVSVCSLQHHTMVNLIDEVVPCPRRPFEADHDEAPPDSGAREPARSVGSRVAKVITA
jgi:hypothetical protein